MRSRNEDPVENVAAQGSEISPVNGQVEDQPVADLTRGSSPERTSNSTAMLTLPELSKQAKAGKHVRMPLVRSSLPNMPLRDLVTPRRPLPAALNNGPHKNRKLQNLKPPQPIKSMLSQPSKSQSSAGKDQKVATTDMSPVDSYGTAPSLHAAVISEEAPARSSSLPSRARSSLPRTPSAPKPASSSANGLQHMMTPSPSRLSACAADTEAAFFTPRSDLVPDSTLVTAASEKHKLWSLVKQQEQQLGHLRQDRADQDAAMLRLRADKADKMNQAMAVRQLQQQLLEVQSLAGHLRSAAEASEARWASKVSELSEQLQQEAKSLKASAQEDSAQRAEKGGTGEVPKQRSLELQLEACKSELAEQAADMEAAVEYATSLAHKAQGLTLQPGTPTSEPPMEPSTSPCNQLQEAQLHLKATEATQVLRDRLAASEAREKALHDELEPCQLRFEALGEELCTSNARLQRQAQDLEALNRRCAGLDTQLQASLSQTDSLQAELDGLGSRNSITEAVQDAMAHGMPGTQSTSDSSQTVAELTSKIHSLESSLRNATSQIEELRHAAGHSHASQDSKRKQPRQPDQEDFKTALDMHRDMWHTAEKDLRAAKQRTSVLEVELRNLQEAVEISQERMVHPDAASPTQSRIQHLETKLVEARLASTQLQEDNSQLCGEVAALQQTREQLNSRLNSCLTAIDGLQSSSSGLHEGLQSSEATVEELIHQIRSHEVAADMAQEMQRQMASDLEAANQSTSRLTAELSRHAIAKDMQQQQYQDLQMDLVSARENMERVTAESDTRSIGMAMANSGLQQLTADLTTAERMIEGLKGQLEVHRLRAEEAAGAHDTLFVELNAVRQQQAADLSEAAAAADVASEARQELQAELAAAKLCNQDLSDALIGSNRAADLAYEARDLLQTELAAEKLHKQHLAEQCSSLGTGADMAAEISKHLHKDLQASECYNQQLAQEIASHRTVADMATDVSKCLRAELSAAALLNEQLSLKLQSYSIGTEMATDALKHLQVELSAASLRNERISEEAQSHRIGSELAAATCKAMHADLERADQRLHSMAQELRQSKTGHEMAAEAHRDTQAELSGLQQRAEQLKAQIASQQDVVAANSQLKTELKAALEASEAAREELLRADSQNGSIMQSLAERDETVADLEQQLAAEQAAFKKVHADREQLDIELTGVKQMVSELKQELQIVHQNWLTLVKGLHEELGAEVSSAKKEAQTAQQGLDAAQQKALQSQQQTKKAHEDLDLARSATTACEVKLEDSSAALSECREAFVLQTETLQSTQLRLVASDAHADRLSKALQEGQEADEKQQEALATAQTKVRALTTQLAAAEASQKMSATELSLVQAALASQQAACQNLEHSIAANVQAANEDLQHQLEQQLLALASHEADSTAARQEAVTSQQQAAQMRVAMSSLQKDITGYKQDIDGYQRDTAALRASLGACQTQSEKFRMELMLAHRSQQGMLNTLEAARQEGDGLRDHLAAQLQGLPALRAMRGQLKAQQHALLGLQEQLQGTSYPALEAAVADGNTAELTQHPRDYETLPTALSTLLNVVPSEHPALEQPDPSHASMSNPPAGAQQLPRIAPPHGNINLPGQPPHGHHTSQQTIQQSGLGRDLSGAGDASMAGPHGPSQAATEPRQDASGRLQAGAGSEPLRGAAILRKSHEGLAALVSQIGQHVSDTEPEYEARKRPRRTISAEGAKENRHRILQKLLSYPEVQRLDSLSSRQPHRPTPHSLPPVGNFSSVASGQHQAQAQMSISPDVPNPHPQHYRPHSSHSPPAASNPAAGASSSRQAQTHIGQTHIASQIATRGSAESGTAPGLKANGHSAGGFRHGTGMLVNHEPGSATSSQGSSAASTQTSKHGMLQGTDKKMARAPSRLHQPVIPLHTQHQAALQKMEQCRVLLEQKRNSS